MALWTAGAAADAHASTNVSSLERRNRIHVWIGDAVEKRGLSNPRGREVWRERAFDFFADTDVLVTPTLAQPPLRSRRWAERGWLTSLVANARYAPFAAPWNMIGWPAMNVPAGLDRRGLPVGVQLVGKPGRSGPCWALPLKSSSSNPGRALLRGGCSDHAADIAALTNRLQDRVQSVGALPPGEFGAAGLRLGAELLA